MGGTSAGLAVLGEFVFSALRGTVYSNEALADPYDFRITLARDFLPVPLLLGAITESCFGRALSLVTASQRPPGC